MCAFFTHLSIQEYLFHTLTHTGMPFSQTCACLLYTCAYRCTCHAHLYIQVHPSCTPIHTDALFSCTCTYRCTFPAHPCIHVVGPLWQTYAYTCTSSAHLCIQCTFPEHLFTPVYFYCTSVYMYVYFSTHLYIKI